MLVIITHAYFVKNKIHEFPTSTIIETLKNNSKDFIFVRHSIDGKIPSYVYEYKKGVVIKEKKLFIISKISLLRYVTEVMATSFYFLNSKVKNFIFVCIDPLNALSGVFLKKIGKIEKLIFYAADYADWRFKQRVMNYFYHLIDKICVKNSDYVWNVSSRIYQLRKKMGLPDEKNIFVPNVPSLEYEKYLFNKKDKYQLVTLGIIGDQLDLKGIIDAVGELEAKFSKLSLIIIGHGPEEDKYKKYVLEKKLSHKIHFLGYLNHSEALKEISKSGIGLALYNGNWHFNYYGDSMKCREFFSFGLPVITTNTHSTVEEIIKYKSGLVCPMNKGDYRKAITDILNNYEEYSQNSYQLSQKYRNIHLKLLENLLK